MSTAETRGSRSVKMSKNKSRRKKYCKGQTNSLRELKMTGEENTYYRRKIRYRGKERWSENQQITEMEERKSSE